MDKAGFLKELEQYLDVLNESEQKDILDEYAQHIDMKMESGMSEQEAIRDFGNIEELATDILEAYHVNPMYNGKKKSKAIQKEKLPVPDLARAGRNIGTRCSEVLNHLWRRMNDWIIWIGKLLAGPFLWGKDTYYNWRERHQKKREERNLQVDNRPEGQARMRVEEIPGKVAGGIGWLLIAVFRVICWGVRWIWNASMLFAAFLAGMFMLMAVFSAGTLGVLLIQGYPLVGFFIGCLGVVLCTGGIAVLAFGLIQRKQEVAKDE